MNNMFNQFHLMGRINVLSKDNQDYPGFYLEVLETKELVPISVPDSLESQLSFLQNNDVVGVKGKITIKDTEVILLAERFVLCSRVPGRATITIE
jgi:hypothetical protein